ncbi:MAG: cytochrome bc complex cytochrome b subunit [Deltaproteobacteria bacterium]|nr:cytochrome bc complex cytochrome b subunit [Deltaproteobacteria bacterium]
MIFNHPFFHFRPRQVPKRVLRFNHTWGLGGAALVLVILLFASGILLKFAYDPFPGRAYDSIIAFQNELLFGRLVRNIHHWSANFLVGVVFLHLLRVFFSGGFYPPRQLNWIFGLFLFVSCLASNFTGYLLPWDQLAYWAVTICTSMLDYIPFVGTGLQRTILGGSELGAATLRIFYTLHTAILPATIILLAGFHFWYIRKAGGIVVPRRPGEELSTVSNPVVEGSELLFKELVAALVVMAFMLLFAAVFDAPLGDKANPGLSPNPSKAPWYFAGIQELLLLFHPVLAVLIIPTLVGFGLIFLPYLNSISDSSGVWFHSAKGHKLAIVSLGVALVFTPAAIVFLEFFVGTSTASGVGIAVIKRGIIPGLIGFGGLVGYYLILRKRASADKNEAVQALFVLLLGSFIVLTVSGIWFRGAGMRLIWPL